MAVDETHLATDERALIAAFLDYVRDCTVRKVEGVGDDDARAPRTASGTSIGGLVKHLTWVERSWFQFRLLGRDIDSPWSEADPEADMRMEPGETLAGLVADYQQACAESSAVLAGHDLDARTVNSPARGAVTLRWIGWHLVEETARHNGHLDILREQLDGAVGD